MTLMSRKMRHHNFNFALDMEEKYIKYLSWRFDEFMASDQVPHYLELFPELKTRLMKFGIGILLWNMKGLIDIDNPDDVNKVRSILRILDQTLGYDFFDNVFNEADPDTVCGIIGMSSIRPVEEGEIKFDYSVGEVKNFEDAHSYFEAVSWSIVLSEDSFNEYTATGNRFYFCGNGDWWDVPYIQGKGFPRDRFGYSLIAVEVSPENKIVSITSRWGTYAGDNGDFITEDELKIIIGKANYGKMICESGENN